MCRYGIDRKAEGGRIDEALKERAPVRQNEGEQRDARAYPCASAMGY